MTILKPPPYIGTPKRIVNQNITAIGCSGADTTNISFGVFMSTARVELRPAAIAGRCAARECAATQVLVLEIGAHRVPICEECYADLVRSKVVAVAMTKCNADGVPV